MTERILAASAHLSALLPASMGIIVVGCMMIILLPRHAGEFLRHQLAQAFAYQALVAVISVAAFVISIVDVGLPGLEEFSRFYVVFGIYVVTAAYAMFGASQSYNGRHFRYIIVGGMADRLVQSSGANHDHDSDGPDPGSAQDDDASGDAPPSTASGEGTGPGATKQKKRSRKKRRR